MRHDEIQELLAAYALDAVDADEAAVIDEHLAACPRCRAELSSFREVAAHLSYAGEAAPAGVWDAIVASMEARPPALRLTAVPGVGAGRSAKRASVSKRVFSAAAGIAALVIAVLGVEVAHLNARTNSLNHQLAAPIVRAYESAAANPRAVHVSLRGSGASAPVPAVMLADGTAYIDGGLLPHLSKDQTYQLWGIGSTGVPVSLAVLGDQPQIRQFGMPAGVTTMAITVERAGGVAVPSGSPLVSGRLLG